MFRYPPDNDDHKQAAHKSCVEQTTSNESFMEFDDPSMEDVDDFGLAESMEEAFCLCPLVPTSTFRQ
jgi:hypothetical protein